MGIVADGSCVRADFATEAELKKVTNALQQTKDALHKVLEPFEPSGVSRSLSRAPLHTSCGHGAGGCEG